MNEVYVLVNFETKETGSREVLSCKLYKTQEDAYEQLEREVNEILKEYSADQTEYPIAYAGNYRTWHDITIPRELTPDHNRIGLSWEIIPADLPA